VKASFVVVVVVAVCWKVALTAATRRARECPSNLESGSRSDSSTFRLEARRIHRLVACGRCLG